MIMTTSDMGTKKIKDSQQGKYVDDIAKMQKLVKESQDAEQDNNKRYNKSRTFIYKTQISAGQRSALKRLKRPQLEFNILNCMIDRLCGEYSKQQPSIYTSSNDTEQGVNPQVLEVIEGYIRHVLYNMSKDNTQYYVYSEQLGGGKSGYKVYADYVSETSLDQGVFVEKIYDPTKFGFSVTARKPTKHDSNYSYELFPMSCDEFKAEYPNIDIENLKYSQEGEGFNFNYVSEDGKKIIVVCDFYKKKYKSKTIVKLSNGKTMEESEYEELVASWKGIEQKPVIVNQRDTKITTICRSRFAAGKMIEYEAECPTKIMPLIFADGNGVPLEENGRTTHFTKPYIFHGMGMQTLINIAGQTVGADIENMTMQKLIIAEESIPVAQQYRDGIKEFQKTQTVVYRSRDDEGRENPPPSPMQRVGLPPEVMQILTTGPQVMQNITGSYDAQLGIQNSQLSGVAIQEGATQSNATAMPYTVNNVLALNQVGQVIVHMLPRIMVGERTIPIIDREGNESSVTINGSDGLSFDYDPDNVNIKIEAGVNFEIEKNRALEQIISLMQASTQFAEFINSQGVDILLDNLNFHGADVLQARYKEWQQEQQQNLQKNGPPPNPELMIAQAKQQDSQAKMLSAQTEQAKVQSDIQSSGYETAIKAKQVENETMDSGTRRIEALATIGESKNQLALQAVKVAAEDKRTRVEMGLSVASAMRESADQEHSHIKDIIEMVNNKQNEQNEQKNVDTD